MNSDNSFFPEIDADVNHLNVLYPCLNSSNQSEYFTSDKFNSSLNNNDKCLSIMNLNIRSLNKKEMN